VHWDFFQVIDIKPGKMDLKKSKILILTEKPSVARDFAKALGVSGKKEGYLEDEHYIITWSVGHLVELFEPQDYDDKWKKWRIENLPILPDHFRYKPIQKTQKQLKIICNLLSKKTPEELVIATDAGREGEVIARTILLSGGIPVENFEENEKIKRFWTSQALTPQVIKAGMNSLKPAGEYDRLWRAGQARQIADWLVGMNGSRSATIKMNDLFSVGRVQTAVLALLVDRRRERENFKPQPYWILKARFENLKGDWWGSWFKENQTRISSEQDAKTIHAKVDNQTGQVIAVEKQKKNQAPPLLYSLTDLQREANSRFGFFAKKTLSIAQALYEEKKCLSYPRTEARVLGTQNIPLVEKIIEDLSSSYPETFRHIVPDRINEKYKRVFDDSRLTDHHAIIPLARLPRNASGDEKTIYNLVMNRFAAAFHADCEYEQTTIVTQVETETFRTLGKQILKPGWKVAYGIEREKKGSSDEDSEDENLPPVEKSDSAKVVETRIDHKETLPPPEYTEALLLRDMTNPARYVTEDKLKHIYRGEIGMGTQATRAQIIETLLMRKYVQRQKRYLIALDKGCFLIDTLRQFEKTKILTSPEETARWEMQLNQIAQGEEKGETFLNNIKKFIHEMVEEFKLVEIKSFKAVQVSLPLKNAAAVYGKCPRCGGDIIEGKKGFGCSRWRKEDGQCRFVIWKTITGKKISKNAVTQLLQKGITHDMKGFTSKEGKKFSARLKIGLDKENLLSVVFDF
jgi:DNA topoisomerase III